MVTFYNTSVTTSDADLKTMKIDFKINWTDSIIEIYVNNVFTGTNGFFTAGITSVDRVMVYNLFQSTSYWRNLAVCSQICYNFNFGSQMQVFFGMLILIGMVLLC